MTCTVAWPGAGAAHQRLVRSAPAADAELHRVPEELRLVFYESVQLAFTSVHLFGPDDAVVALGPLRAASDSAYVVIAAIDGALGPGAYVVRWQTTGADGHPVAGEFAFTVIGDAVGPIAEDAGEAGALQPHHPETTFPGGGSFDAESPGYVVVRWVTFLALAGVVGAAVFGTIVLWVVRRQRPDAARVLVDDAARRAARLGAWLAGLLLLAAVARLMAQLVALRGGDGAAVSTGFLLGSTVWGTGWILQFVAGLTALAGFLLTRTRARSGWSLVALAATALVFTPALSGHAAAAPRLGALAVLADGLHILGVGGWLGSLLFVLAAGVPAARRLGPERSVRGLAALVFAFSPTALFFAGLLTTTGVLSAWLHLGPISNLWRSEYGRTLLLKLGVLSLVFGTGAYNFLRVKPALADGAGARRLRRSAALELAIGAVVLLVTAVLVATAPPADLPPVVSNPAPPVAR